ncbi:unnamed protein product [Lactuca saligna]|uniref:Uncharacterized protein n=1 Tax=Lactuca saligna TaxID=75948 RepID=A0AA35Y148_LACSI|nr:unnamed protein product [Lactuca saligna]
MYSTTTFRNAYSYRIAPINGSDMWPHTNYDPSLRPISKRMPGGPTTNRKKSTTENKGKHKASTSKPQEHDEVELTLIQVDTTQNDFQDTLNDSKSSSARGSAQYMHMTPPRSYDVEDFVCEYVEVENVEGSQGEANGVVEDIQREANGVVEDGQG